VPLPDGLLDLLRRPSLCYVATTMPDGSPQLTQTWVDTDGEHILVNVVDGMQKARNVARDARVAVTVTDPDDLFTYYGVRGRVVKATTEGARESIDAISQKYLGTPYPGFGPGGQTRLLLTIEADSINAPRG
jgi:PPOX class probable F420-dependent enzyme